MDIEKELAQQEELRKALGLSPEDFEDLVAGQANSYESITGRHKNPDIVSQFLADKEEESKRPHMTARRKLWESLPREDRDEVLEKIATTSVPVSAENMMRILYECVIPYLGISPLFTQELLQNVYRCNTVRLQPIRNSAHTISDNIHEPIFECSVRLSLPPLKWRSEIKTMEFNAVESFPSHIIRLDTWQELKNVCFPSKYHFHNLNRVIVFFEVEMVQMQSFWNWDIHIETGARVAVIDVRQEGWEGEVKAAVEARRGQHWYEYEPGFKLYKRVQNKPTDPGDHGDDAVDSVAAVDDFSEEWDSVDERGTYDCHQKRQNNVDGLESAFAVYFQQIPSEPVNEPTTIEEYDIQELN
ncbi:hypothetical protein BDV96DRAFT_632508 [Lophiotrema nucula]|uniref:Uncharacterized protein n=1 Tax=Lophiotrema nucula TaxID=690887 RepID=A0A6A5Z669_9PLEO|nr:hypothetical protein BDV96DRAFT_632508 [Lophiotrema nucula]